MGAILQLLMDLLSSFGMQISKFVPQLACPSDPILHDVASYSIACVDVGGIHASRPCTN